MGESKDRTNKKSKKKRSASSTNAETSTKDRSAVPDESFLSDGKIKSLTSNQQLWLFAFPEAFNITSLSNQELDIPDKPAPNSIVASFTVNGIAYEVFENSDAENIVNIVPENSTSYHVPGRPFQRSFTIRKVISVPTINLTAIRKQEKVAQVVEAARRQTEEITRTQPMNTKDCAPQPKKKRLEDEIVVEAVKKTKKHKKDHSPGKKEAELDQANSAKKQRRKDKKRKTRESQEPEKKRKISK